MVKYLLTRTMLLAILGLSALGSIGIADAAATGGGSAVDTVTALGGARAPDQFDTAYVDVDCPGDS
jgi:hypothetical protein